MFGSIRKRNGTFVPFDSQKIESAISRALQATKEYQEGIAKSLKDEVCLKLKERFEDNAPSVEEIQDVVEETLLNSPYKKTAKAYILYRDKHEQIREIVSKAGVDLIDQYLKKLDWQVKENSNMSYSLQGLNNYISSETSKIYWLNKIYSKEVKKGHLDGDLHIHDLGLLSVYCVGWDLFDLLSVGFKGVSGKVESAPPKHFRSALGQMVNFFYTLQGEAAGAQAFSSFDTLLAPFVRSDGLSKKEVKQALQEFVFNLNVPTRVGFQTPFTNITMDLNPPVTFADTNVVIGGEVKKETYGDFQEEMNLINECFLEVMTEGDAKGRIFTFPIPTYNISKDFDWEHKGIEKLWEAAAKYGIPYFANFVNSDMDPSDARSMCCRLRLDTRTLRARGGGLFGANPLTGSIGVVTLNLPRIAFQAKTEEEFMTHLLEKMAVAKESLEVKREVLEKLTDQGLYPYSRFYLRSVKERLQSYWSHHFGTIGILGMNEACMNLLGVSIATEKGQSFAKRVLDEMRDVLLRFQEETGHLYNLEATPAEATSYRLALLDKKKMPEIQVANEAEVQSEEEAPFYTNSTQLPVHYTDDLFEALDLQDPLQTRYTGGTVFHAFLGERMHEGESVKKLVKTVCENYHLPYFTLTPTFSICPTHGYLKGEMETCNVCESTCEIYSRVVGYYRPTIQWNEGKQAEFCHRKEYIPEGSHA